MNNGISAINQVTRERQGDRMTSQFYRRPQRADDCIQIYRIWTGRSRQLLHQRWRKFGEFNYKSFQRGSAIRSADLSDPSIVICELNLFPRLQIASKQAEIMRRKMGK